MRRFRFLLPAVAALAVMQGCKDSSGPSDADVGTVTLNAPQTQLAIGATVQFSATVLNTSGGTMANPRIQWTSGDIAIATVTSAGLVTARAPGVVTITAKSGSITDAIEITVLAPECTTTMTIGTIPVGQTRTGALAAASDCRLPHGGLGDGWRFSLGAMTTIRGDLTSSQFDALLVITDLQFGIYAFNDDAPGSTNSTVVTSLPAGEYIIWATAFPGEAGAYQLQLQTAQVASCTTASGTISTGQTDAGTLEPTDCLLGGHTFADLLQFTAATTTTVQIDLTSPEFDTYLYISAGGTVLAADDDGGNDLNSRLVFTFEPGTYLLWASSYEPFTYGAYQLSVTASGGGVIASGPADGAELRDKSLGQTWPWSEDSARRPLKH